ncbi:hypothetical protein B484DRAFT_442724 [Ochromonadaceae sp. CCMP2298]|nr:hypothetical protein B484DRAFT_442724 [Ochromonadaceae sp. CCMP2298]
MVRTTVHGTMVWYVLWYGTYYDYGTYCTIVLCTDSYIGAHTSTPTHLYTYTPLHLHTYTPLHLHTYTPKPLQLHFYIEIILSGGTHIHKYTYNYTSIQLHIHTYNYTPIKYAYSTHI